MAEIIAILVFLFPLLVYYCTRYIRSLDAFSLDIFPQPEKMDNIHFAHRKKYYFGFTHTNNFRPPKRGEWYQSESDILPVESGDDWDFDDTNISSRSRWILTKNFTEHNKPVTQIFHNLPHINEKSILRDLNCEDNTVRIGRQWIRGMLTNGRPNIKLEPLIEGMLISLYKNLVYNGYNVIVDEPVVGNRSRDFWKNAIEKANAKSRETYGFSDVEASLKLDSEKPIELQYGGASICNYGLDNFSYSWASLQKLNVIVVLENTLISDDGWSTCNSSADVAKMISKSTVDAFVKTWLQETAKTNPIVIITTLPEYVANEAYRFLRNNEIPFKFLLSRRNREIKMSNTEVVSRIVTDIPSYRILHVIDSDKNNYTWDCMHGKVNKLKVIKI